MRVAATGGRLRRLDERAGQGAVRLLARLGLVERPAAGTDVRLMPTLLRLLGWAAAGFAVGMAIPLVMGSGAALLLGRLAGFADVPPVLVASIVKDDPFSDRGVSDTDFGATHTAYSPIADTFSVRIDGANARIDRLALVCHDGSVIELTPSSDTVSYVQNPPWPCPDLVIEVSSTNASNGAIYTLSLDGSRLPGDGSNVA